MFTEVEVVSAPNGGVHGDDCVSRGDADLSGDTVPAGMIAVGGAPHWGSSWGHSWSHKASGDRPPPRRRKVSPASTATR
jgi:hypothetical protein